MLSGVVIAVTLLPSFLTLVWCLEVVAGCLALLRGRTAAGGAAAAPPFTTAVLVPAHNEGAGTLPTIGDVQAQLGPADRIVVVADNCDDDTAAIARAAGAEVIVRSDPQRRGKGFALEFGVRHLSAAPPDVVVVLDADCRLDEDALRLLSQSAMASGRPVQALYHMLAPANASPARGVSLFAWRIKNWLRPLGMKLCGLPTQLFGTGMAFPFALLEGRDLGNSRLAEDTALGLALAAAGRPPLFAEEARIHSHFPVSPAGGEQQRQRWEKGHLDNIVDLVPGAIASAFRTGSVPLGALAIDMAIPPLTLLALANILSVILGGIAFLMGASSAVLALPAASVLLLVLGVALAWSAVGRDVLPVRNLLQLPLHAVDRMGFYRGMARGKGPSGWIRTDRK
jgi:cellulose synthase/poly-beta-1,6-N-acetylglucosamine synthase-like glycosyltransferase